MSDIPKIGFGIGLAALSLYGIFQYIQPQHLSRTPSHAPTNEDANSFPEPAFLKTNHRIKYAFCGQVNAGKSYLINILRNLKPNEEGAAPVGSGDVTGEPIPYNLRVNDDLELTFWDLPGCGTVVNTTESYIVKYGLRWYTGVFFVTENVINELGKELLRMLHVYDVPFYIVRTKIDIDLDNYIDDHGIDDPEACIQGIRNELKEVLLDILDVTPEYADERIVLTTKKCGIFLEVDNLESDIKRLEHLILEDLQKAHVK